MPSEGDIARSLTQRFAASPVLRVTGVRKSFPGVQALWGVSFDLYPGEIHALVGENGAGKSTLIKILTGVHRPDTGGIEIFGETSRVGSPFDAGRAGMAAIYQELTLVPALTVAANLFLGREQSRRGFLRPREEKTKARAILSRLGVKIDPSARASDLSVSEQQLVEIARALLSDCRILIMDEPTAALAPREVRKLFELLRDLVETGLSVIFISHRLDEVLEIADRVTVMRDGLTIATRNKTAVTRSQLIAMMVGRSLETEFPKVPVSPGLIRFEALGLSGRGVENVSFHVRAGEILGVAGLMGAGRTELARLIFGADARAAGEIRVDGRLVRIESPRDAIAAGICLLTEDRKSQGLVLSATARENFALPNLNQWSSHGWIRASQEADRFSAQVSALGIRLSGPHQRAEHLSGGNQQKLLVARWLESDSKVVFFDEPTRGIDVGAKYEMYQLICGLAARGKAIILISSELSEVIGMSDRVLVMRRGCVAAELTDKLSLTQESIMARAV